MQSSTKPHFVLIPWLSTSHIIPMADVACLLATHGAPVTVVTTPTNAPIVHSRVDRATPSAATIAVTAIPFPAAEAGLPEGCERIERVPSPATVPNFFDANTKFGEAVSQHYRGAAYQRPSCIIAGACHTWALGMAREFGVPCFYFFGYGAFATLCIEYLQKHEPHVAAASPYAAFDVPVLPPFQFKFTRRQLPSLFQPSSSMLEETMQEVRKFQLATDGIVLNSFEELEHGSVARLAAVTGKKVLAVGPVSLCHKSGLDSQAPEDARRCMSWLDAKKSKSVIYVSFGSNGHMPPMQLMQLGMALVSCPWPVLWVIKGAESLPDDAAKWLLDNTDADGVAGSKCFAVRGWAPQVAILEHPAVGGFLTHCGWGSTLESVAAGVPMATWPFFSEQFLNEKLIVNVLGIGVSIGVTKPTQNILSSTAGEDDGSEAKAEVGMEQVKRALERLMDEGTEAESRWRKAQQLKVIAKAALEKGGSSYMNLENWIHSFVGLQ